MSKSEQLRLGIILFLVGCFFGNLNIQLEYFILIIIFCFFLVFIWKSLIFTFFVILLSGLCYAQFRDYLDFKDDQLPNFHNKEVELKGVIISFPDIREKNHRFIVAVQEIKKNRQWKELTGQILLIIPPPKNNLHYGQNIHFKTKLQAPRNFEKFDYKQYLRRFSIQSISRNPIDFQVISDTGWSGFSLWRIAEDFRSIFSENLEKVLPNPHSKIAMGILLGIKNELPDFVKQNFQNSGLQHLLVVSGFNVSVVLIVVTMLLKGFGKKIVFISGLCVLIFFTAMTGAEPPIVRAALMGAIVAWATATGRMSDGRNVLFFSVALIALYDPKIIQSDIGFYLSFSATLGIILGVPVFLKLFKFLPPYFREVIVISLVAQISVLPILGYFFGEFVLIGFISNIIIEPFVPIAMLLSFIAGLFGFLPIVISKILAIPAFIILEIMLWIAHFFGAFSVLNFPIYLAMFLGFIVWSFFIWASFSRFYTQYFLILESNNSFNLNSKDQD